MFSFFQLYSQNENVNKRTEDLTKERISFNVGLYGGYLLNSNSAKFMQLPEAPNCCAEYDGGKGSGYSFGALLDYPIFEQFDFQLKFGLKTFDNKMTMDEFIGNGLYMSQVIEVTVQHSLTTDFSFITLSPGIAFKPLKSYNVFLSVGLDIGLNINSSYAQFEAINPTSIEQGVTYLDGSIIRNNTSGAMTSTSTLYLGIYAGLGYDFKVSDKFIVTPELSYGYALTDLVTGISWKTSLFSARVGVKYQLDIYRETERIRDTVTIYTEPKEKVVAEKKYDQSELKNYACHYIVYSSYKTEEEAMQSKTEIEKSGIKNISIENWKDEFTTKTFYRIRSQCFNSLYKANEAKNEQIKLLRNINLPNDPAIKSK